MSADDIQQLTRNLCYQYAICTRSVSIVTPVYYAHRVAARAAAHASEDWELEGEVALSENVELTEAGYKMLPVHEKLFGSMYYM